MSSSFDSQNEYTVSIYLFIYIYIHLLHSINFQFTVKPNTIQGSIEQKKTFLYLIIWWETLRWLYSITSIKWTFPASVRYVDIRFFFSSITLHFCICLTFHRISHMKWDWLTKLFKKSSLVRIKSINKVEKWTWINWNQILCESLDWPCWFLSLTRCVMILKWTKHRKVFLNPDEC